MTKASVDAWRTNTVVNFRLATSAVDSVHANTLKRTKIRFHTCAVGTTRVAGTLLYIYALFEAVSSKAELANAVIFRQFLRDAVCVCSAWSIVASLHRAARTSVASECLRRSNTTFTLVCIISIVAETVATWT